MKIENNDNNSNNKSMSWQQKLETGIIKVNFGFETIIKRHN